MIFFLLILSYNVLKFFNKYCQACYYTEHWCSYIQAVECLELWGKKGVFFWFFCQIPPETLGTMRSRKKHKNEVKVDLRYKRFLSAFDYKVYCKYKRTTKNVLMHSRVNLWGRRPVFFLERKATLHARKLMYKWDTSKRKRTVKKEKFMCSGYWRNFTKITGEDWGVDPVVSKEKYDDFMFYFFESEIDYSEFTFVFFDFFVEKMRRFFFTYVVYKYDIVASILEFILVVGHVFGSVRFFSIFSNYFMFLYNVIYYYYFYIYPKLIYKYPYMFDYFTNQGVTPKGINFDDVISYVFASSNIIGRQNKRIEFLEEDGPAFMNISHSTYTPKLNFVGNIIAINKKMYFSDKILLFLLIFPSIFLVLFDPEPWAFDFIFVYFWDMVGFVLSIDVFYFISFFVLYYFLFLLNLFMVLRIDAGFWPFTWLIDGKVGIYKFDMKLYALLPFPPLYFYLNLFDVYKKFDHGIFVDIDMVSVYKSIYNRFLKVEDYNTKVRLFEVFCKEERVCYEDYYKGFVLEIPQIKDKEGKSKRILIKFRKKVSVDVFIITVLRVKALCLFENVVSPEHKEFYFIQNGDFFRKKLKKKVKYTELS